MGKPNRAPVLKIMLAFRKQDIKTKGDKRATFWAVFPKKGHQGPKDAATHFGFVCSVSFFSHPKRFTL